MKEVIHTEDVLRYNELDKLIKDMSGALRKMTAERDEKERVMIAAIDEGGRVETGCPFKLQIETSDKRYSPGYKACAIEFAGEAAVAGWVNEHDPHDTVRHIGLVPKLEARIRASKPYKLLTETLPEMVARPTTRGRARAA